MNTIDHTEKIDAYLSGTMSDADKKEFEGLLLGSKTSLEDRTKLQDEMELQKEIIFAIRRRGFREMVKKDIADIQQEKDEHHRRIKRITLWSLGGGGVITALAAVMLLLLVTKPIVNHMQEISSQYVSQWEISDIRGGDEYEDALNDAIVLMQEDKWNEAGVVIDDVYSKTQKEQGEHAAEIHELAEWLKAIWLMHEGSESEAKDLLQKIAESDSYYSNQASDMLEKL